MKVFHRLEIEEPMHCQYPKCKEELNGLHHCWTDVLDFRFELWLCDRHFKKLEKSYDVINTS